MNNDAITSPSSDVTMFLYSFKDLIPMVLNQWYLYHIDRVLRLGLLEPYPWIITHISTPEFQNDFSFSAEKQKKKSKRGELAILTTATKVRISFAQYRVVICLDISESSFSCTSVLNEALLSILTEISANAKSNNRIIGVQLSIIAHMPEIDETWSIWQGEVTSESDAVLLQSLVRARIELIEEISFKTRAEIVQNGSRGNSYRFPDCETFLRAILFHLRLLPGEACPKVILLTSGSMTVKTGADSVINQFSKYKISFHVLIEQIPRDRPVGYHSDIYGLNLLADQTVGGCVEVLTSTSHVHIDNITKKLINQEFFSYLAFGYNRVTSGYQKNLGADSSQFNNIPRRINTSSMFENDSGVGNFNLNLNLNLNLNENHIQSYSCEGATVEHFLSVRQSEGFKIIDISYEREKLLSVHATQIGPVSNPTLSRSVSAPFKKQPFLTFARQHAQMHQPIFHIIIIKLEKKISKLRSLIYQISYRKESQINRSSTSILPLRSKVLTPTSNTTHTTHGQLYNTSPGPGSGSNSNPSSSSMMNLNSNLNLNLNLQGMTMGPKGGGTQMQLQQMQGSKTHVKQSWEKAIAGQAVSPEELVKLFDEIR